MTVTESVTGDDTHTQLLMMDLDKIIDHLFSICSTNKVYKCASDDSAHACMLHAC